MGSAPGWEFDGQDWKTIAAVVFGTQVLLFQVSLVVDAIWFPVNSQGFFAAMLLFAVLVGLDALSVSLGWKRAAWWAFIVTIAWIFGAIPYARHRQHLRRSGAFVGASRGG
jgi:hypothetical protein